MLVRAFYTMLETGNLLQQLDQFPIDGLDHGQTDVNWSEVVTNFHLVQHRVHVGKAHAAEFVEISFLILEIEPADFSFLVIGMILQLDSVFRHDLLSDLERQVFPNVDRSASEVDFHFLPFVSLV